MEKNAIARWSNPEVILVATDLLEDHTLIQHAKFQARISNAAVLLVHIIPPPCLITEVNCNSRFGQPGSAVHAVRAKLDESAREFRDQGIPCTPIVLNGIPEEELPALIRSRSVDRVIVATRNTIGVARLLEGSVAERLIDVLEVPVCVIGPRATAEAACGIALGRVLLATSLHPTSSLAASLASALAEVNHAHLRLLHVFDSEGMSEQQLQLARLALRHRLAALVPSEARHRFPPVLLVREGDPSTIVLEEAGSSSPDIVILGAPHSSMASQLLSGSVVHRVIVESKCPVITIRSISASSVEGVQESIPAEVMHTRS